MAKDDLTGIGELQALLGRGTKFRGKLTFEGRIRIDGEPGVEYVTEFIGTREGYDARTEPVPDGNGLPVTRRYSGDIGTVLATAPGLEPTYTFVGDEIYVRARIRSTRPVDNPVHAGEVQMAWVQPVSLR